MAAALALRVALLRPRSPVLVMSPTQRQSGELFRKIQGLFNALGRPMPVLAETAHRLELANGSRILSLPGTEETIRGFSDVVMLIIDEAARVADALYVAVRPMLAVSRGRLVALSTPVGKRGWVHDEWHGTGDWTTVNVLRRWYETGCNATDQMKINLKIIFDDLLPTWNYRALPLAPSCDSN